MKRGDPIDTQIENRITQLTRERMYLEAMNRLLINTGTVESLFDFLPQIDVLWITATTYFGEVWEDTVSGDVFLEGVRGMMTIDVWYLPTRSD